MSEKLIQLIINELSGLNYHPVSDKRIKIHCPFHTDSNPSLNVALGHPKLPPGSFKCFSCGEKGTWNKLAERLKLKTYHDGDLAKYYDKSKGFDDDPFADLSKEINRTTAGSDQLWVKAGTEELPMDFSWRGLPREFWIDLGFSYYWDYRKDQFYLYLPMTMYGKYIGYTLAAMTPDPNNGVPKYQTFAQTEFALLNYDSLIPNSTILIVEGHFDTWRMISKKFNCTGMIGTENWSKYKTASIKAKLPKRVIVCTDGDQAGYKAGNMLNELFTAEGIDTVYYKLPEFPKPNALDPGNMPDEYIEDLRRYII